jgi:hypothetical protein
LDETRRPLTKTSVAANIPTRAPGCLTGRSIAFISMINIPFGTALGVYTVIVLLPSASGQDYQRLAVPA